MAIEITQEMRQAIHEADCEELGHQLDLSSLAETQSQHSTGQDVIGPDNATLPHIRCHRCDWVWLLMPEPFKSYEEAEQSLKGKLKDPEAIKPRQKNRQPEYFEIQLVPPVDPDKVK